MPANFTPVLITIVKRHVHVRKDTIVLWSNCWENVIIFSGKILRWAHSVHVLGHFSIIGTTGTNRMEDFVFYG